MFRSLGILTGSGDTSSGMARPTVKDYVDNTAAPPTEVLGDRYILDDTGTSHANWDGAAALDIVEFDGTVWVVTTPIEGMRVHVDAEDVDRYYIDDPAAAWEKAPYPHASDHTDGTDDIQDATAGQKGLATAAQITSLEDLATTTINDQTGTTYTFVLADGGEYVRCTNAAAITVTVPPNSSVAFPIGTQIVAIQGGTGQVTFAPGGGVTLNGNLSITAQNLAVALIKVATDEWDIVGGTGDAALLETVFTAADEIIVGTGAGTHNQVTLGASEFLAKKAAGAAINVSAADARTILNVEEVPMLLTMQMCVLR